MQVMLFVKTQKCMGAYYTFLSPLDCDVNPCEFRKRSIGLGPAVLWNNSVGQ